MSRTPKGSAGGAGEAGGAGSTATPRRSPRGLNGAGGDSLPPAAVPNKRADRDATSAKEPKARKKRGQDSPSISTSPAPATPKATPSPPRAVGNGAQPAAAGESASSDGPSSRSPAAAGATEEEEAGGGGADPTGGRPANSRREAFAQVARARGAHFARPDKKPAPGTARAAAAAAARGSAGGGRARRGSAGAGAATPSGSEGTGNGTKELWPGPFAEARRLMDNREAAAALRESIRVNGRAQAASDEEGDSEEEGDETPPPVKVEWKPRGKGSRTGKSRAVPSLFRLCLNLLADNFDHIESLGDVSPEVRNHLAAVMCRELKLTTEALQRLSEPGVTEVILPDCSRIEPDQMRDSLLQCRRTLRVLRLGTCGRCVGDATFGALAKDGGAPKLEMASLAGTYQLTDEGVLELLSCCPRLTGLELPANSRITLKSLGRMVDSERPLGMALTSLSLADCIQLGPGELEPLKGMSALQSLSLSGLSKLTDATLLQALEACGWRLRHLDISDCTSLTDASLRAVGERCGVLESFSLGMCPLLTTGAVQELFQYSGSSADASKGFRAPASSVTVANGNADGGGGDSDSGSGETPPKGKGKGKGKSKGKGKASKAAAAAAVTAGTGGSASAAPSPGAMGSSPQDGDGDREEGDDEAGAPVGHAMLKSRLTRVSLRGLVQVDDKAVTAMAAACSGSLRTLDLKGLALVTDNTMVALARYCSSSLESLDLSFCRGASDDGLGHLVDSSPSLNSLRLWGCTQVTDRFLKGHSREELAISRY